MSQGRMRYPPSSHIGLPGQFCCWLHVPAYPGCRTGFRGCAREIELLVSRTASANAVSFDTSFFLSEYVHQVAAGSDVPGTLSSHHMRGLLARM
jgi:hypothetical protein